MSFLKEKYNNMKKELVMSTMEIREDLLNKKLDQIETIVRENLKQILGDKGNIEAMQLLLECNCLKITPPQQEPPMMSFLTIDSLNDYHHGNSIKPGNIKINMKRLIDSLPEIVTATVSIINDITILKICAAIIIWKMLRNVSTIEIKKEQAIIIVALWKNCNEKHIISLEDGYKNSNMLYKQVDGSKFTWDQYIFIIEELEKIESIKLTENGIWLCEWVSKNYVD